MQSKRQLAAYIRRQQTDISEFNRIGAEMEQRFGCPVAYGAVLSEIRRLRILKHEMTE